MVRCRLLISAALLLIGATSVFAQDAARAKEPAAPVAVSAAVINPAVVPEDRLSSPVWAARHVAVLEQVKRQPDAPVIFVGDSITQNYEKNKEPDENFLPIWERYYAPRKALNLGFSGDMTEHVLWRLQNGEVDGLHPKVAVVLIGTNNTNRGKQTAAQTQAGVDAVVAELQKRMPKTQILLLGILPSGISPEKTATDQAINSYLAKKYAMADRVTFLDIGQIFYEGGKLNEKIFYDTRMSSPRPSLHPDTVGQRMMAEAIEPVLARLLGEKPIPPEASEAKAAED
jgi:lysophospholipase L1-like esterase